MFRQFLIKPDRLLKVNSTYAIMQQSAGTLLHFKL